MKVIKLDRRYKTYRRMGHTVGLRFSSIFDANRMENLCRQIFDHNYWYVGWYGYYGSRVKETENADLLKGWRPYFITFRNPEDLTLLLLSRKAE